MRLKIQKLEAGLHPNEAVASIRTSTGIEWLVVDKRSILKNSALRRVLPSRKRMNFGWSSCLVKQRPAPGVYG